MAEPKILMIVESPNKRATLKEFLPSNYTVMASVGHVTQINDSGVYNMGIDPKDNFKADYIISPDKKDVVKQLKEAVRISDKILLCSDDDNEGEAIAKHLKDILKIPESKYERVTFHEITKKVVLEAIQHPRKINENKALSAITRQKLDKIVGYRISPIVMAKCSARSAGRVQSAAERILVEREEEIQKFVPKTYYELWLPFTKNGIEYRAQYKGTDAKKVVSMDSLADVEKIKAACKGKDYIFKGSESTERKVQSKLPFTTSTFQQEVSSKLGYAPKKAMECAQHLFEGIEIAGKHVALITYMRTDSTDLNAEFVDNLKDYVEKSYGKKYYAPVKKGKKGPNVQDAHEAIRPVDLEMTPEKLNTLLDDKQLVKVYKIIYARTVAASMSDCIMEDTEYSIYNGKNKFSIVTHSVKFDGFKKVYAYKDDDEDDVTAMGSFETGEVLDAKELDTVTKQTNPPKRYSEAALVKKLEDLGIGRPSTYANTVEILKDTARGYNEMDGKLLKPVTRGMSLIDFMRKAFPDIVDLAYSAKVEADMDRIATGEITDVEFLNEFYTKLCSEIDAAKSMESTKPKAVLVGRNCPKCGKPLVYRMGKYGKFIACTGYNGTKKGCTYSERLDANGNPITPDPSATAKPKPALLSTKCPKCGKPLVQRVNSKTGEKFYACSGFPKCRNAYSETQYKKLIEKGTVDIKYKDRE